MTTLPSPYPIKYSLINGELPEGLHLMQDGSVRGIVAYGNFYPAPEWQTASGRLLITNELETIDPIALDCTPTEGATSIVYSLVPSPISGEVLPWGLYLDWETGIISGTVADYLPPNEPSWLPEEEPIWVTPTGSIGTYNEQQTVSFTFNATPYEDNTIKYAIVEGNIPFGISLNTITGLLSGTLSRLPFNEDNSDPLPEPIWITNNSLGNFQTYDNVSISFQAVSLDSTIESYSIISGIIPFGLTLNPLTGEFSGTLARFYTDFDPIVNTIAFGFNNGETLINTTVGSVINYTIPVTPKAGSVVSRYIAIDGLPFGLSLNTNNGNITGTIDSKNIIGDHIVNIVVSDTKNYFSKTTFKIVIGA